MEDNYSRALGLLLIVLLLPRLRHWRPGDGQEREKEESEDAHLRVCLAFPHSLRLLLIERKLELHGRATRDAPTGKTLARSLYGPI